MTSPRLLVVTLWLVAAGGVVLMVTGLGLGLDDEPAPLPEAGGFSSAEGVADPGNLPEPSAAAPGDVASARSSPTASEPASEPAPDYSLANHLWIPSLGIDAPVVTETVEDGELTIPGDPAVLGRWDGSAPITSSAGTTLLAGHVSFGNLGLGALFTLHEVQPGAVVVTTDGAGQRTAWRITSLEVHEKDALPPVLFDAGGARRLALVTCGGELTTTDDGRRTYEQNVVALAEPVPLAS